MIVKLFPIKAINILCESVMITVFIVRNVVFNKKENALNYRKLLIEHVCTNNYSYNYYFL